MLLRELILRYIALEGWQKEWWMVLLDKVIGLTRKCNRQRACDMNLESRWSGPFQFVSKLLQQLHFRSNLHSHSITIQTWIRWTKNKLSSTKCPLVDRCHSENAHSVLRHPTYKLHSTEVKQTTNISKTTSSRWWVSEAKNRICNCSNLTC